MIVTVSVFVVRFRAENYSELAATVAETVNFLETVTLPSKILSNLFFLCSVLKFPSNGDREKEKLFSLRLVWNNATIIIEADR